MLLCDRCQVYIVQYVSTRIVLAGYLLSALTVTGSFFLRTTRRENLIHSRFQIVDAGQRCIQQPLGGYSLLQQREHQCGYASMPVSKPVRDTVLCITSCFEHCPLARGPFFFGIAPLRVETAERL